MPVAPPMDVTTKNTYLYIYMYMYIYVYVYVSRSAEVMKQEGCFCSERQKVAINLVPHAFGISNDILKSDPLWGNWGNIKQIYSQTIL